MHIPLKLFQLLKHKFNIIFFAANLDGHKDGISCLAKHPTKLATIISGAYDGEVKIWDLTSQSCIETVQAHDGHVRDVCYIPDGNFNTYIIKYKYFFHLIRTHQVGIYLVLVITYCLRIIKTHGNTYTQYSYYLLKCHNESGLHSSVLFCVPMHKGIFFLSFNRISIHYCWHW